MSNQKIVFTNPDGSVGIIHPAPNCKLSIQQIAQKDVPSGLPYEIVDESEIPTDRTFRNAWRKDRGKPCHICMDTAREIHKERLRLQRIPKLQALDVEYQKADEKGDVELKAKIAAKKQALRDCTKHPCIAKAKTPEELKEAIPPALKD